GALSDERECTDAGGRWAIGSAPGGGTSSRCFVGFGVLSDLDAECSQPPCEETPSNSGECAACHAPGIDGPLDDRGLLEAAGFAYDFGVHCDICHKVDDVDMAQLAPGVAGRLRIHRPPEPFGGIGADFNPIYFGPSHDSPNLIMGSVQRDHYRNGEICAGCHEYEQPVQLPGASVDASRWPSGRLPIHSTWTEWRESPFAPDVACNACHMPPAPSALNSADLQLFGGAEEAGVTGGFVRSPGEVRQHTWVGPSQPTSGMLSLSAALDVDKGVKDGVLTIRVTTSNVGAGHRIPTGEPSRALILRVDARCGAQPLSAMGGDVVPPFVGVVARRSSDASMEQWPDAQIGDTLVALRSEGPLAYAGFGPFAEGGLDVADQGMTRWSTVSSASIVDVDVEGRVVLSAPLQTAGASTVFLSRDNSAGEASQPMAGLPGFAFARVLTDPEGTPMVPHHRAVDVISDNRLAPHTGFTTTHLFAADCEDPVVEASLRYRRQPAWLAQERGWDIRDELVQGVTR
ncbi:MAG: hypothetical protein AB8H79_18620, partial [Myxococcota bacterium]